MGQELQFFRSAALPLPHELRAAIAEFAAPADSRAVSASSAGISEDYRERRDSRAIASAEGVAAYALTRLPATYAAVEAALAYAAAAAPGFAPGSLLDLGCGPGTASWAAVAAFPGIGAVAMVDTNPALLAAARELAAAGSSPALRSAQFVAGELAQPPAGRHELVILSYALTELPAARLSAAVAAAWSACSGVLLIVEPGTPRDYQRLLEVRSELVALGGQLVAPCPHAAACPLTAPDWCHFSVRLARSRDHMHLKGGTLGYEDEKFSYLAVARPEVALAPAAARILARPLETKFDATLKLCQPDGTLAARSVPRRDKAAYRAIRRLGWGDSTGEA